MLHCISVCCSFLQCIAVCCGVLQRVTACCSMLQHVAACCSMLQRVAACCSSFYLLIMHCTFGSRLPAPTIRAVRMLQCVAVCCSTLQCIASLVLHSTCSWFYIPHLRTCADDTSSTCAAVQQACFAVYYSVLQCVAVRCSALQCIASIDYAPHITRIILPALTIGAARVLQWNMHVAHTCHLLSRAHVLCVAVCCSVLRCVAVC